MRSSRLNGNSLFSFLTADCCGLTIGNNALHFEWEFIYINLYSEILPFEILPFKILPSKILHFKILPLEILLFLNTALSNIAF